MCETFKSTFFFKVENGIWSPSIVAAPYHFSPSSGVIVETCAAKSDCAASRKGMSFFNMK